MTVVTPGGWRDAVELLMEQGYRCFDWLGCVDEIGRSDELRIVLSLRNLDEPSAAERQLSVRVDRSDPQLDSLRSLFAGAAWHEREAAELFGVRFSGGDRRRLLLSEEFVGAPLRKEEVLAPRTALAWPGAKEPGETDAAPSRRRLVPPGVPEAAVWGDRDPAGPEPGQAEVAESAVGGRARRRRP